MTEPTNVKSPFGGTSLTGNAMTIDEYVNPPTRIPEIIRDLVGDYEGYFIEDVFHVPGFTVEGGAVIYTESFPEDHFLPEDQTIAPRAPGANAPTIGSTRRAPKLVRPESWAGTIEVTKEMRRRNDVRAVQKQFTQAANTFADRLQTRGIQTLNGAVTAWERVISTRTEGWRKPVENGVENTDPLLLPEADFAAVEEQFIEDKAGEKPDTLIINQRDAYYLRVLYGHGKLKALLESYGIRFLRISPLVNEGAPIWAKSGSVGHIGFEAPLEVEHEYFARPKKDEYTLEFVPAFVADNAAAVLSVSGVNEDGTP
jgi:hypothetical protein